MSSLENETAGRPQTLRVINIGLQTFYDALLAQDARATQLEWRPPVQQSAEISELLADYL